MNRTEENTEMINDIYKQLNKYKIINYEEIKTLALLDISKSLAVIADYLKKEEKEDD